MSKQIRLQWQLPETPHLAGDQARAIVLRNISEWERTHKHGLPQPRIVKPYVLELSLDEDDSWTTVLLVTWKGRSWDRIVSE